MEAFAVDQRIMADCHLLGKWKTCWVMLHRDSAVRWLIIVPETHATEWHELPEVIKGELLQTANAFGALLTSELQCDKVNLAAIGNIVSQFHLHLIGRWRTDPYWPGVVWGRSSVEVEYSNDEVDQIRKQCFDALNRDNQPIQ